MTASTRIGVVSSRCWTQTISNTGNLLCSLPTAPCRSTPKDMACRCGLRRCSCIGRGNGERAGWRASSTNNCNWIGSGRHGFRIRAKGPAGGIFCKRWCAIGSSIRAASGGCTVCGLSKARWAIFSGRTIPWSRRTRLAHKQALFGHLRQRWQDMFGAKFDILLYDLTSTYFECDPPDGDEDKRRFGYNRDKRNDCVQVVIALVVTPDGFPLGYEVLAGNTRDSTTLRPFLRKIEEQYGKAKRIWVMDRGIPTEEVLAEMRQADPPIYYLVGTPKGRLTKLEKALLKLPWQAVREGVNVKLLRKDAELYVLAKSDARILKERGIRRRKLRWLLARPERNLED